ncbi:MAG: hypothetical protein U0528_11540 [Anaerolineae bacterium]|nr:hypothetical protein [Anaerolineae bacterium]
MSANSSGPATPAGSGGGFTLSEDWLATIIGLVIALIIGLGVLGPGQQTVTLDAAANTTASKSTLAISGWSVSATLAGKTSSISAAPKVLQAGATYVITCENATLSAAQATDQALPEGVSAAASNRAQIAVVNKCPDAVRVTYTSGAAVPYPLFRIF